MTNDDLSEAGFIAQMMTTYGPRLTYGDDGAPVQRFKQLALQTALSRAQKERNLRLLYRRAPEVFLHVRDSPPERQEGEGLHAYVVRCEYRRIAQDVARKMEIE